MDTDIIVSIATCTCGNGALGIIRTSGKGSIELINKFVNINLLERKDHTINVCNFLDENKNILDEVLVLLFFDGHSYTKEESVEISCHNSIYILESIIKILIKNGARMATNGEYTRRAYLNGRFDLIQAESVADLIASRNKSAHDIAINQMKGGLSNEINKIKEEIIDIGSQIETSIEFTEEDIETDDKEKLIEKINSVKDKINKMLSSFSKGEAIKKGLPIAIIGKPNVGKSSLLNALLNENRVIVSPIAGTTRDAIDVEIKIGNINCRFIDTAGLRNDSKDVIENIGIEITRKTINKASLILFVIDINMTIDEYKDELDIIKASGKDYLIIVNKIDLNESYKKENEKYLYISAKNNTGIDQIKEYIKEKYKIKEDESIINLRHFEIFTKVINNIENIKKCLKNNSPEEIIMVEINNILNEFKTLNNKNSSEEILDNIFSKFCIGK